MAANEITVHAIVSNGFERIYTALDSLGDDPGVLYHLHNLSRDVEQGFREWIGED